MKKGRFSREPVYRMLGALRAMVWLAADCNIQFRAVDTGVLHEARVRATANYPLKERGWCSRVWRYRQARCKSAWEGIVRKTIAGRKAVCDICHAGLQMFSVPVYNNGRLVGMLLCSQIPHKSEGWSFRRQVKYVRDLPVKTGEWKERYGMSGSYPTDRMMEILEQCRIATEAALSYSGSVGSPAVVDAIAQNDTEMMEGAAGPAQEFQQPLVARARKFLENHLEKRVTLKSLASSIGCSPITLTRKFRKSTGESIPAFINRLRVRKAEPLLSSSALSMSEILRSTGFTDARSFRRIFRREVGLSPRDYRQQRWLKSRGLSVEPVEKSGRTG